MNAVVKIDNGKIIFIRGNEHDLDDQPVFLASLEEFKTISKTSLNPIQATFSDYGREIFSSKSTLASWGTKASK